MRGELTKEKRFEIAIARLKNSILKLKDKLKESQEKLKEKDKIIKELTLKLEDKELQRKNLLSKIYKFNKKESLEKPLGKKPGAKGYQRPRPRDEDVTEEVKYIPNKCPFCHNRDLLPAQQEIVKYQEDIVIIPEKIVKKYIITKHWCPHCQEYVRSNKIPPEVENLERIGPNVMAYVLYARYRLRLPFNKIKQSLADLHNFKISEGEIANQLEKAGEIFKEDYQSIVELIKYPIKSIAMKQAGG